jgi:predicted TIM-barrel fold metal-dependent hydrolase
MVADAKPRVIALEEHYWSPSIGEHVQNNRDSSITERLRDLGEMRLREMDEAGIDLQVISHAPPGAQNLNPETAVEVTARANDYLHAAVAANAGRFAGFAVVPTPDPAAAADELERCVTRLGFKGALVAPLTSGVFLDDKRFWPIYERAQALDVPIYVHPGAPHPAVFDAYYKDYVDEFPSIATAGWGYTVETATQAIRLILSGVFERYPELKIILGHMGESIPFSLTRIDEAMSRRRTRLPFREIFCHNFYITTSGNFSTAALMCSILEMGVDRIMFSVDWPYVENLPGMKWMEIVPLSAEDKTKIYGGNAARLLKL